MEKLSHGENLSGSTAKCKASVENGAEPASTAPQPGTSTPEEATASAEGSPERDLTPDEKYFRGLVYATETDTETGEVTEYRRPCTKIVNPQTGTPNRQFQKRFSKHTEWVAGRRGYGKEDLFHAVVTLHEEDMAEANLSPGATRSVFEQLASRLRDRLDYRDGEAEALLSHAKRPNTGEWHVHFFVLSKGCTLEQICQVFRVDGADTEIITPFSGAETDEGDEQSAAEFARVTGWYLFQNRIEGAKSGDDGGFSSWTQKGADPATDGVGYSSVAAKENRRRHAAKSGPEDGRPEGGNGPDEEAANTGAGSKTQNREKSTADGENNGGSAPSDNGGSGTSDTGEAGVDDNGTDSAAEDGRAPPVHVPTERVETWRTARRIVLSALSSRMGSEVRVRDLGRARLTWVEVGDEGAVVCHVRPLELWDDDKRLVSWRKVERDGAPIIRQTNPNAVHSAADSAAEDREDYTEEAKAYCENARHSRVGVHLPNGNVHDREWRDGEKIRDEEVQQ